MVISGSGAYLACFKAFGATRRHSTSPRQVRIRQWGLKRLWGICYKGESAILGTHHPDQTAVPPENSIRVRWPTVCCAGDLASSWHSNGGPKTEDIVKRRVSLNVGRTQAVRYVLKNLRRAFQRDDWQMSSAIVEVDVQCESIAWLSGDERERFGACRRPRPAFARFDAWSPVGGP